jgi:D-glucosaminate-6-phosphate ammonia-lyase
MSPSTSTRASTPVPTFASIGVRPVINCMGTFTILSGSRALTQVVQAMAEATDHYVNMDELMRTVGERLGELMQCEFGYVATGCAAALSELTAACMAGADPEKMARLPNTEGMRNEVISQKRHRNVYDHAIRLTGARFVEVVTRADLEAAISERTAMLAITGSCQASETIPVGDMIAVGRKRGIPCIVDAAAERPDVPNRYLSQGADAVAYSGGKCLRGPQSSGLVLGRRDLLWAAFLNGAPHHALCRPMKASKEEVMGLLAAVDAWVNGRDHQAEWRMWEGWLDTIRAAIATLPMVRTRIEMPGLSNVAPMLSIAWDERALACTAPQIAAELRAGDPPIVMHARPDALVVMPYMLEAGEAEVVAQRLVAVMGSRPSAGQPQTPRPAPAANIAGTWRIETTYSLGSSVHSMTLKQEGGALSGDYRSQFAWTTLQGSVSGNQVAFTAAIHYEASGVEYAYKGVVEGDTMRGTVEMGEYFAAEWVAHRV